MNTFILVALQGDRHEDMIPEGLFTIEGFIQFLNDHSVYGEPSEDDWYSYCLFFMEIDKVWNTTHKGDYDMEIIWNARRKIVIIDVESENQNMSLEKLQDFLISSINQTKTLIN